MDRYCSREEDGGCESGRRHTRGVSRVIRRYSFCLDRFDLALQGSRINWLAWIYRIEAWLLKSLGVFILDSMS